MISSIRFARRAKCRPLRFDEWSGQAPVKAPPASIEVNTIDPRWMAERIERHWVEAQKQFLSVEMVLVSVIAYESLQVWGKYVHCAPVKIRPASYLHDDQLILLYDVDDEYHLFVEREFEKQQKVGEGA